MNYLVHLKIMNHNNEKSVCTRSFIVLIFEEKKMNIGIDIDDTINNLHEIIFEKGKEFNKKNKIVYNENPNEWHWDKAFGWDEELASKFLHENIANLYLVAGIKPDAAEVIRKIHDQGNKIIIITSRSEKHFEDPYNVSKKWLDEKNVIYDKLIVGAIDKAKVCVENNIDFFIDDHVDFCEGVTKANIKVLMFDSPYNQKETKYKRVYNWKEVYENIVNK